MSVKVVLADGSEGTIYDLKQGGVIQIVRNSGYRTGPVYIDAIVREKSKDYFICHHAGSRNRTNLHLDDQIDQIVTLIALTPGQIFSILDSLIIDIEDSLRRQLNKVKC